LGKFVVNTNSFQIPVDWKIDKKLVKDLVQARLAELDSSRSSFLDPRQNNK